MPVQLAFIMVILVWSTTPLAIKWSGDGPGFLFGVTGRMVIGALLCFLLVKLLRVRMPWDRQALRVYAASAIAIYGAMSCVYWGAQMIPSGLIAVLFGLTTLVTSFLAAVWLSEDSLTIPRMAGLTLGLVGLVVIFQSDLAVHKTALYGIGAILMAVLLHSTSTILVKRGIEQIPGLAIASGGLLFSLPLYLLTWWIFDGQWPTSLPSRAGWSIIYLGVFGSVIGYALYYYALTHVSASRIALITLVTPVTALLLGVSLNNEVIGTSVWVGASMIIGGLVLHQWGTRLQRRWLGRL